ncbi:MAG: F0F1 ATP synthase subunit A [Bryobacteraceae bacterium]
MPEHELWLTKFFNDYLAGPASAVLSIVGVHVEDPSRPWANFVTMQIAVAIVMAVLFAILRSRLSMDRPGKLQQSFEVVYEFLDEQSHEQVGHHSHMYVPLFGTLFLFILFANLIGIVPGFESPTIFAQVPLGCALVAFLYYNISGIRSNGLGKYLGHFAGPMPFLAPLMIPIEIISHLARPLSLTIRLYANMYAGEQVFLAFLGLTYLAFPALFMGLHVFVSFLQAYVFTLLTMIYVAGAVAEEH